MKKVICIIILSFFLAGCSLQAYLDEHFSLNNARSDNNFTSTHATTKMQLDTDLDGVADVRDECPNTTRNVAVDGYGCPVPLYLSLRMRGAGDGQSDHARVQRLATLLKDNPRSKVVVTGHTDNMGDQQQNKEISQKRADRMKEVLVSEYGIDPNRVTSYGYGSSKPLVSNASKAGRARNKRMEITIKGYYAAADVQQALASSSSAVSTPASIPQGGEEQAIGKDAPKSKKYQAKSRIPSTRLALNTPTNLHFATAKSHLTGKDTAMLKAIGTYLQSHPKTSAIIEGHTDSKGTVKTNLRLSKKRAQAIRAALVKQYNISSKRLKVVGFGESKPIASNDTEKGRSLNRRVTVILEQGTHKTASWASGSLLGCLAGLLL